MVDMATQSENEDLSDIESSVQQTSRKPSFLQVVPEEEHEDDELVNLAVPLYSSPFLASYTNQSYSVFVFTLMSVTVESYNSY